MEEQNTTTSPTTTPTTTAAAAATSTTDRKRPRSALVSASDEQTKRGKRMFGALMGTLTKQTTVTKTEAEKRREETEKRLREKLAAEKLLLHEEVEKEKEAKMAEKRERIKAESEKREELTAGYISKQKENLSHFLRTKTEPVIYFLPGKHNQKSLQLLEDQRKECSNRETINGDGMQVDLKDDGGQLAEAVVIQEESTESSVSKATDVTTAQ